MKRSVSERLRALRERGLVTVERRRGFPVRTRYDLTEAGRALRPLLVELYATGERLLRLNRPGFRDEQPPGQRVRR
ncbi:winged helix-turn-helix transcriptional regulator [Streptomyces sp. sk2.1]|uniref:winged helix-turn-helix transcriptional regulator n=1 Tax=Streptomyces sp. sk2.1 TaxID=2478959 RepID=UPI0021CC8721|nr:winged helix-turn-helix transcriptional regulator [Streptomyces sp. sk2.1]